MYFPVLRAKQNELIGIRELADSGCLTSVRPVLEPVRDKVDSLLKTVIQLNNAGIEPLLIVNPSLGDFASSDTNFLNLISNSTHPKLNFLPCFSTKNNQIALAETVLKDIGSFSLYLEGRFSKEWEPYIERAEIVLVLGDVPQKLLESAKSIVYVADGFQAQNRNSDYPEVSNFNSNWHTEYKARRNCIGFGDYTIIDTSYSETGGPAYVVALHLSYIDPDEYDAIKVKHFKSYNDSSPTQPGLKFKSALGDMIKYVEQYDSLFVNTLGLGNFKTLYAQNHFPGLGQVKKNSIQHHIETVVDYVKKNG
jgi:hypothetical protein